MQLELDVCFQTAGQKVDHQAAAYVAPKKAPLTESNSNSLDANGATDAVANSNGLSNGVRPSSVAAPVVKKVSGPSSSGAAARPRWGGAEICPRCGKSVSAARCEQRMEAGIHEHISFDTIFPVVLGTGIIIL